MNLPKEEVPFAMIPPADGVQLFLIQIKSL